MKHKEKEFLTLHTDSCKNSFLSVINNEQQW